MDLILVGEIAWDRCLAFGIDDAGSSGVMKR